MKNLLLLTLCLASVLVKAQAPVIDGDLWLCPNGEGTASIISGGPYDTHQWYSRDVFFGDGAFHAIEGATGTSHTYSWYTDDLHEFKVVVTLEGQTYESNIIYIQSYGFTTIISETEYGDDVINIDGVYLMCDNAVITSSVLEPYTANVQWHRDGQAIPGATQATYLITAPGVYHVVATPPQCPDLLASTETMPFYVEMNPDCSLGTEEPSYDNQVTVYPNPAKETLNIRFFDASGYRSYVIYDTTGKLLLRGAISPSTAVDISALSSGTYFVTFNSEGYTSPATLFIKQ